MSDAALREIRKQVKEIIFHAEKEEKEYNWNKAIQLLKKAEKISIDNSLAELEGKIYYKLGEYFQIATDFEKTKEQILEDYQLSIIYFQKACNSFKQLNNEGMVNASLGSINLLKYISGAEVGREVTLLETARENFTKAKLKQKENKNTIESINMEILEKRAEFYILTEKILYGKEPADFKENISETENFTSQIWEKIKNQQDFPEIYLYHFLNGLNEFINWIVNYYSDEDFKYKQYLINNINKFREFVETFENSSKKLCYLCVYVNYATYMHLLAIYYSDDQFEQRKYLKKALRLMRNVEITIPNNPVLTAFYFIRNTISIVLLDVGFRTRDFRQISENFTNCINSIELIFPRSKTIHLYLYLTITLLLGALNRSIPNSQSVDFTNKALDIVELVTKETSVLPDFKENIFTDCKNSLLCTANALLGDLLEDKKERSRHFQIASNLFDNISTYNYQNYENSTTGYMISSWSIPKAGMLLAQNASILSEKINYYQKTIELLSKSKKQEVAMVRISNLFIIGSIYYRMGRITNDNKIFKKSYLAYMNATEHCKNNGYYNLVGSGHVKLAQIEDHLGNFLSAAKNYQKALESFDKALLTLTYAKKSKKIVQLKEYLNAWKFIEIAKSFHVNEDHHNARLNYEKASKILEGIRDYKFEAPLYTAWAILENAEYLSKENNHKEAAIEYLKAREHFEEAIEPLSSSQKKRKISEKDKERISLLLVVANIRAQYCNARYQIETARLESKQGNHLLAAELYSKASALFEKICQTYRIKREKDELRAVFYLCKAWENMEQAEDEQESSLYASASELFEKASIIFPEKCMKQLSLGNSLYCSALKYGSYFDKSIDFNEKSNFYKKIKTLLRESSKNYQLGGFEHDAQWALATSTVFDGIWQLIQSDNEIDFSRKNQYLNIATNYLNSAINLFEKAGYTDKKEDIFKYLEMIKAEKAILTSALEVIEKPAISASSIGISAPSCPVEISSSVNISEMQQHDLKAESELNWQKRIHHLYLFIPGGTCIYDHPFESEVMDIESISASLVTGGLEGISNMIQELTKKETKLKILEQEDITILLEHGKDITAALITEENLETLRSKLKQLIDELEKHFQTELETFDGDITVFSKAEKCVQKIFIN